MNYHPNCTLPNGEVLSNFMLNGCCCDLCQKERMSKGIRTLKPSAYSGIDRFPAILNHVKRYKIKPIPAINGDPCSLIINNEGDYPYRFTPHQAIILLTYWRR